MKAACTEMTRRYGRAMRGERVHDAVPAGHWQTLTLPAALDLRGVDEGVLACPQSSHPGASRLLKN